MIMKLRLTPLAGLVALLLGTSAGAETCHIQVTGAAGDWKFVHVYDVAKGTIVMRQAIKVGETKQVTVSGSRVRVDWKFAGHRSYTTGAVKTCKGGNTIEI
jgi:hypothetical protein